MGWNELKVENDSKVFKDVIIKIMLILFIVMNLFLKIKKIYQ